MASKPGNDAFELLKQENQLLRAKLRLMMGASADSGLTLAATVNMSPARKPVMSFEGVNEGILEFDSADKARYANRIVRKLLGREEADIIGKTSHQLDLLPWAPGVFEALILESRATGAPAMFEAERAHLAGGQSDHFFFEARIGDKGHTHIVVRDVTMEKRLRSHFEKHVGTRVLSKIMECGITDEAERQDVTMLFADLRGFTSQSAELPPEEVRSFINDFLRVAMDVVDRFEGSVDKIVGDEVMALFGAPLSQADDPYRAVLCAVEMQRAHGKLQEEYRSKGKTMAPMGIGINTGPVVVGHIGSGSRVDYTVIGHHVNLAARLCSGAKGGQTLVGRGTVDAITAFTKAYPDAKLAKLRLQGAGTIEAKGIAEPVKVYEALD